MSSAGKKTRAKKTAKTKSPRPKSRRIELPKEATQVLVRKIRILADKETAGRIDGQSKILNWAYNHLLSILEVRYGRFVEITRALAYTCPMGEEADELRSECWTLYQTIFGQYAPISALFVLVFLAQLFYASSRNLNRLAPGFFISLLLTLVTGIAVMTLHDKDRPNLIRRLRMSNPEEAMRSLLTDARSDCYPLLRGLRFQVQIADEHGGHSVNLIS